MIFFLGNVSDILEKEWFDETFLVVFAYCVMLHETAGILTIITASVITPAGVSNDFNADYIY